MSCSCTSGDPFRIALALYGLPRSTNTTSGPLRDNVIAPLRKLGCVDIFLVVTVSTTAGRREIGETGMSSSLGWRAVAAFDPCRSEMIDQDVARADERVPQPFGPDTWNDGFGSVRNHLMELYSVKTLRGLIRAHERVGGWRYTHAAVARIDTLITQPVRFHALPMRNSLVLPLVGTAAAAVNDRFAYGDRSAIVDGHLARWDALQPSAPSSALHAELLLCCVLRARKVGIYGQMISIERVRLGGGKSSARESRQVSKQQALLARIAFKDREAKGREEKVSKRNLEYAVMEAEVSSCQAQRRCTEGASKPVVQACMEACRKSMLARDATEAAVTSSMVFKFVPDPGATCHGTVLNIGNVCFNFTCAAGQMSGVVATRTSLQPQYTARDNTGQKFRLPEKVMAATCR